MLGKRHGRKTLKWVPSSQRRESDRQFSKHAIVDEVGSLFSTAEIEKLRAGHLEVGRGGTGKA